MRILCQIIVTFFDKTNKSNSIDLDWSEFKKSFLSVFENISLYTGEQKSHYNRHLMKKFRKNKDILIRSLQESDSQKRGYITFVDLRRIFDSMQIVIEAELVEYLIYLMKSFKDDKASLYDLQYEQLVALLRSEENLENLDEDSNEQSYEITPEKYNEIVSDVFRRIGLFCSSGKIDSGKLFKEDVVLVEEENTKERYEIIELKDFIAKLENVLGLDLKELEIYCLYTRLKFDDVENDLEAISYVKLRKELDCCQGKGSARERDGGENNDLRLNQNEFSEFKNSMIQNKPSSISQSGHFKPVDKIADEDSKINIENEIGDRGNDQIDRNLDDLMFKHIGNSATDRESKTNDRAKQTKSSRSNQATQSNHPKSKSPIIQDKQDITDLENQLDNAILESTEQHQISHIETEKPNSPQHILSRLKAHCTAHGKKFYDVFSKMESAFRENKKAIPRLSFEQVLNALGVMAGRLDVADFQASGLLLKGEFIDCDLFEKMYNLLLCDAAVKEVRNLDNEFFEINENSIKEGNKELNEEEYENNFEDIN